MKKLFIKEKILRNSIKIFNNKYFILKSIIKNKNIFVLLRYKALLLLKIFAKTFSINALNSRCVVSYNKKNFNKFSFYSRFIFLKNIHNKNVYGLVKSKW